MDTWTTNRISEMTYTDFDERRKVCHTVIIPSGAVEGYGPHLPMGSDILVANAIAEKVAEKTDAMIAPVIPVGDSRSISMFPGTLVVRPESFKEYLRDLLDSLYGWGMRNFLFINGHAGNVAMIAQLSQEMLYKNHDLRMAQIDWWRYVQQAADGVLDYKGYMAHGHASECGTSVLLYLYPHLVHMERAIKEEPKVVNGKLYPGINRYTRFCEFSDHCMIGDASAATAEKGKILVERSVESIVEYMKKDFVN